MTFGIINLNFVAASVMLLFTSYLDLKYREIPDKVWIIFGAVGVVLSIYEIDGGILTWQNLVIAVGLAGVIGMGVFFLGLYGGADGKALIVLALLVPYYHPPHFGIYSIAPLIVLTNGVLLSMLLPIALLVLNTVRLIQGQRIFEGFDETVSRKILATFLGYKSAGKPREFQFSMEKKSNGEGSRTSASTRRKFDFALMQDDFETRPGTWVTPGIPLLVFFTAGFFGLLFYGDLVIAIISFFAHVL
jgi:archaeal preflagellin peptidase FlaK